MLKSIFAHPTNEYRGKPFWSWNGKLQKDELIRQIHVMKEMGLGGFFMHSRTGLRTEYLGDEWFDLINACVDEAEKLHMEAWLYDEDRWPSGSAGGKVTVHHEYRLKYLRMSIVPAAEFTFPDDFVAAFTCDLDGLNYANCQRITPDTSIDAPTVLLFTTEEMAEGSFYNDQTYLDTLNIDATRAFLESTHELYKQRCGDKFGSVIRGVFTDEPFRGMVMCNTDLDNPDSGNIVPWTESLFGQFADRFGYDLIERLPEIFLRPDGAIISPVKWHYMELIHQMFLDNFMRPCQQWCRDNNLIFTGHVLHEDTLTAQAVPNGSMLRSYEYMDYPGVDLLTEGNKNYWVVKQLASVARQQNKPWLLSELYGCTGWQMNFQSHKAVGLWQTLLGINLRCHHLSWYTMQGEAKRDYPASILHQSTWYQEYQYVEDYFSRIHVFMQQGRPCCDLLVIDPIETLWAQIHSDWAKWIETLCPDVEKVEQAYADLFSWLSGSQIDFDYGNEDHIARFAATEQQDGRPVFKLGAATYRAVLVSGLQTIRASTLTALREFAQAGGTVIFAGNAPTHVDACPSNAADQLARECNRADFQKNALLTALTEHVPPLVTLRDAESSALLDDVYVQVRRDGDNLLAFIANMDRDNAKPNLQITLPDTGFVEHWQPDSGAIALLPAESLNGTTVLQTTLPPSGELLLRLTPQRDKTLEFMPTPGPEEAVTVAGPFAYQLDEPNVIVLDRPQYRLDNGPWSDPEEILRIDRRLREHFNLRYRGGTMVQPWYSAGKEFPILGQLELKYTINIDTAPTGDLFLALELPETFTVSLNGAPIANTPEGWWVDPCIQKLPIPADLLKQGENTLLLRTDFKESTDLEAAYLLGNFGVTVTGADIRMTALPDTLTCGDITPQGLPFYTGKIAYRLDHENLPTGNRPTRIELAAFGGACVTIGKEPFAADRIIAWQPLTADITELLTDDDALYVNAVLTRKNAFGPLHQNQPARSCGPHSFLTEGDAFSYDYLLIENGLLKPITLHHRS